MVSLPLVITLRGDPQKIDSWNYLYKKPRLSHEICIQGSYTDLSLEARYQNSHVGKNAVVGGGYKPGDKKKKISVTSKGAVIEDNTVLAPGDMK